MPSTESVVHDRKGGVQDEEYAIVTDNSKAEIPQNETDKRNARELHNRFDDMRISLNALECGTEQRVLQSLNFDLKQYRKRQDEVKEQKRTDLIDCFSGKGSINLHKKAKELVSAAKKCCVDNKDQNSHIKIRHKRKSEEMGTFGVQDMHFVKVYRGEDKMRCHEREARFYDTLQDYEAATYTSSESPTRLVATMGSGCIVRPSFMLIDPKLQFAMTILPLCPLGDAFDLFSGTEQVSCETHLSLWNDVAEALKHLAKCKLLHGDLKLENILHHIDMATNQHRFALTDHEFSGPLGSKQCGGGTPNYSSPKRLKCPPQADPQCDAWSFAITIIAAWYRRLIQQGSKPVYENANDTEQYRAYDSACPLCGASLILSHATICLCSAHADVYQPMLDKELKSITRTVFERFSMEKGEALDELFKYCGGAECGMLLVEQTLIGLLDLSDRRLGVESLRMLI